MSDLAGHRIDVLHDGTVRSGIVCAYESVLVRFHDGTSSTIRAENIVSVGEMDAQDTGANTEECIARVADGFMRMNSAQKLSEIATGVRRRSQTLLPARVRH